jgi:hypothetical protein
VEALPVSPLASPLAPVAFEAAPDTAAPSCTDSCKAASGGSLDGSWTDTSHWSTCQVPTSSEMRDPGGRRAREHALRGF